MPLNLREAGRAPSAIGLHHHFGVAAGAKRVACGLELRGQFAEIVDRAVEHGTARRRSADTSG